MLDSVKRIKKECLLHGYDFEYIKLKEDLYILYNFDNFVVVDNLYLQKLPTSDLEILSFKGYALNLIDRSLSNINSLLNIYLPNLTHLFVFDNFIFDIKALSIERFPNLISLDLYDNEIKCCRSLFDFKNLTFLDLSLNNISKKQSIELKNQLTTCDIIHV